MKELSDLVFYGGMFLVLVFIVHLLHDTFIKPPISTEWHDCGDGMQRRQWGSGSSSETAHSWIEYRKKP